MKDLQENFQHFLFRDKDNVKGRNDNKLNFSKQEEGKKFLTTKKSFKLSWFTRISHGGGSEGK